jgi:hypothetical protein
LATGKQLLNGRDVRWRAGETRRMGLISINALGPAHGRIFFEGGTDHASD